MVDRLVEALREGALVALGRKREALAVRAVETEEHMNSGRTAEVLTPEARVAQTRLDLVDDIIREVCEMEL